MLFAFQYYIDNSLRNMKVTPSAGESMYVVFPPVSWFLNVLSRVKWLDTEFRLVIDLLDL
jgi:hypothetical protein